MINNGTLIVIAAILVWITMCFPVEGRKGLILMLVRGILYLLITGLLLYVIVGKYPELGWAFSIIVLSILDVLSIVYALWCIYRAGKDLKTRQTKMIRLHRCKLWRGKTIDDGNGTYQLFGVDDQEIKSCIEMLMRTDAGTGFMHESFHKDNPQNFTRSWFAWANTLFGELILRLVNEKML